MKLTTFSYVSSLVLHLLVVIFFATWLQFFRAPQEIVFSNVTLSGDGASGGSIFMPVPETAAPKPPAPRSTDNKLEKAKSLVTSILNKAPDALLKSLDKSGGETSAPAKDQSTGAQNTNPASSGGSSGPDSGIQPGGKRDGVGPAYARGVKFSYYPEYPAWAQEQGIQTDVVVKFFVNADGEVIDIDVEKVSGYPRLDYLCRQAMKRWKFDSLPPEVSNRDPQWGRQLFKFRLQ